MSREEFIKNYLNSVRAVLHERSLEDANTRVIVKIIGSIWDLQKQIAQLQENLYAK